MKVVNIPRRVAKDFEKYQEIDFPWFSIENSAWISISEPGLQDTVVSNYTLDQCPKLRIAFWDVVDVYHYVNLEKMVNETAYPPLAHDAKLILNFLKENWDRNIIVNCQAGCSRSGGVADFCEKYLGYDWLEEFKQNARPNPTLFKHLGDQYIIQCKTEYEAGNQRIPGYLPAESGEN